MQQVIGSIHLWLTRPMVKVTDRIVPRAHVGEAIFLRLLLLLLLPAHPSREAAEAAQLLPDPQAEVNETTAFFTSRQHIEVDEANTVLPHLRAGVVSSDTPLRHRATERGVASHPHFTTL